jgi:two-component system, response regulator PdtaR
MTQFSPEDMDGTTGHRRPPRILIAEDDFLLATEIEEALKEAGYEVLPPAQTAEEAIALAIAQVPALALVDIELFGVETGIDLAMEMRESVGVRSIFVSAHSDPETVAAAAKAEPISWLKKPFGLGSIVAAVQLAMKSLDQGFDDATPSGSAAQR